MIGYGILLIDTDGNISPIDLEFRSLELHELQRLVGGYLEVVRPLPFSGPDFDSIRLVVDEEGLLKDKKVNVIASALYGSCIVGDCVLVDYGTYPESDIFAIPSDKAQRLYGFLFKVRKGILLKYGSLT